MLIDCKNLDRTGLERFAESLGQPPFRGRQIMSWLYRPGITDFSEMTDLAKSFRALLPQHACISRFDEPHVERSQDGTVKFGFRLADNRVVESVLIPEEDRNTLCISAQVGCAMACSFCRTGSMGFARNLLPAEIVNQVSSVRDFLLELPEQRPGSGLGITNLVFMGMGEPLNNFDHLLTALAILTDQKGLDMASRRITVSTCGIVPNMQPLGEKTNVNLAISLHAVDDDTRNQLMPINRRYPIAELLEACRNYPMRKRKRIMFEYLLLDGINDSDAEARQLARLLRKIPCKINLLAYNECEEIPYRPSSRERILAFQDILRAANYSVFIRSSRGGDISAACGQLASSLSADTK
jgi:23S rRNA (adenine2503-C2)-methyltransferase